MSETIRMILPLQDIQKAMEGRIGMLEGMREQVAGAVAASQSSDTRLFNDTELKKIDAKLQQLQNALGSLNDACCPNPMDCPHEMKFD
jgi:hypothetical protein